LLKAAGKSEFRRGKSRERAAGKGARRKKGFVEELAFTGGGHTPSEKAKPVPEPDVTASVSSSWGVKRGGR